MKHTRHPNSNRLPALFVMASIVSSAHAATVLNYPDFSNVAGLQLNGNSAQVGNVLRVTPSAMNQSGSVFSTSPVTLTPQVSFSTYFSFRMSNPGGISDSDGQGADGITFVVQTNANNVGGLGGGIGYQGLLNSVGIEFDSWNNGSGLGDPNGNHVAIDINGNLGSPLVPATQVLGAGNRLNNGSIWYAWVDYNGPTDLLEVRLASTPTRPALPLTSAIVDLTTVLGSTNAYVGFTSGTGSAFNDHDILAWEFRDNFSPIIDPPTNVPESGATLPLLGVSLAGLIVLRRRALCRTARQVA